MASYTVHLVPTISSMLPRIHPPPFMWILILIDLIIHIIRVVLLALAMSAAVTCTALLLVLPDQWWTAPVAIRRAGELVSHISRLPNQMSVIRESRTTCFWSQEQDLRDSTGQAVPGSWHASVDTPRAATARRMLVSFIMMSKELCGAGRCLGSLLQLRYCVLTMSMVEAGNSTSLRCF